MVTLGELIGGLAAAVTRAGAVSDAASARIAAEYRSDPVLRSMTVPRSAVDGVEFRIVFAFADPAATPWPVAPPAGGDGGGASPAPAPAPARGGGAAPGPSFGPSPGQAGGGAIPGPQPGPLVDTLEALAHDLVDHGPLAGLFHRGVLSKKNWKLAIPELRSALDDAVQGHRDKALHEIIDAATGVFGRFLSRAVAGAGGRRRCIFCFWRRRNATAPAGPPPDPETLAALRGEIARRAATETAGPGAGSPPSTRPQPPASSPGGPGNPEDLDLILDPHVLARLPHAALQQMAVTISNRPGEPAQVAFLGPAAPAPADPRGQPPGGPDGGGAAVPGLAPVPAPSPTPSQAPDPASGPAADPAAGPAPASVPPGSAPHAASSPAPAHPPSPAPAGSPATAPATSPTTLPTTSPKGASPGIRFVPPGQQGAGGSPVPPRLGRRRRLLRRRRDLDG